MDIICPKCGEPWDNDEIHSYAEENASTYSKVAKVFRTKGCGVAFEAWSLGPCKADRDSAIRYALADLSDDDMDGYAADMEDITRLGIL